MRNTHVANNRKNKRKKGIRVATGEPAATQISVEPEDDRTQRDNHEADHANEANGDEHSHENEYKSKGDYDKQSKQSEGAENAGHKRRSDSEKLATKLLNNNSTNLMSNLSFLVKFNINAFKFFGKLKNADATSIAASILVMVFSLWLGLVSGDDHTAKTDDTFVDCRVYIDRSMIGATDTELDDEQISDIRRQTAKRIYSTMMYYGLRPEQCFAMLGNWRHESGIDPTAVETVFDEKYSIGPTKERAILADFKLSKWNYKYWKEHPTIDKNGIGLGQWTNDRNEKLLTYAQFYGMEYFLNNKYGGSDIETLWYDLDVQLAFALDTSELGDTKASWFETWKEIGREEWDGDKEVELPFVNIPCWSSPTSKGGIYDSQYIWCHPVGENNNENTIAANKEADDYYDEEDRKEAIKKATKEMAFEMNTILDKHSPSRYASATSDGVDKANEEAKKDYIKQWKKYYRYYLYKLTVERYTEQFMIEWEGINDAYEERKNYALVYFEEWWEIAQLKPNIGEPNYYVGADDATNYNDFFYHVEEGYASAIKLAKERTKDKEELIGKDYTYDMDMSGCSRVIYETRRNLAISAALLAWPNNALSHGNNGTDLFQKIYERVVPEDEASRRYQSCDRTVCTAVRWAGYDDNYPQGPTINQIQYLVTSPRWVELAWGGDRSQLQPGDILIRKDSEASGATLETGEDVHHTVMYIGEHIAETFADTTLGDVEAGACIVHGSFEERSPAIDVWSESFNTYHAFRCVNPMEPGQSKYVNVGYVVSKK